MVCMGERERSLAWLLNIKSENQLSKLCFRVASTPKLLRKVEILCKIHVSSAAKPALSVFSRSCVAVGYVHINHSLGQWEPIRGVEP